MCRHWDWPEALGPDPWWRRAWPFSRGPGPELPGSARPLWKLHGLAWTVERGNVMRLLNQGEGRGAPVLSRVPTASQKLGLVLPWSTVSERGWSGACCLGAEARGGKSGGGHPAPEGASPCTSNTDTKDSGEHCRVLLLSPLPASDYSHCIPRETISLQMSLGASSGVELVPVIT